MSSPSMNKAIASYVMRRAEEMNKDPSEVIWLGDLISAFLHSPEHASAHEHDVAELIKAAIDSAMQLDDIKNCIVVSSRTRDEDQKMREKNRQTVERVYAACEALGVDLEKHEVAA